MRPVESPPRRQTQSYLRELMQTHGLSPKNKLGQNFLVDLNLLELIVGLGELTKDDLVLEVGTGTGGLTAQLADSAGAVLSVEVDPQFHRLAEETLGRRDNVVLFHGDILRNKNELRAEVLERLGQLGEQRQSKQLKLVSNLPYAVATPVISNLLLLPSPLGGVGLGVKGVALERLVVTVQWEIAAKLAAAPGSADFGALSVLVQSLADVEICRRLPPTVFWPRPQVDSAIVRIWPRPEKRSQIGDAKKYREFLRDLYAHRRKNLRGGLVSMAGADHDKATVDAKLAELGMDGSVRAETLSLEDHRRLFEAFA